MRFQIINGIRPPVLELLPDVKVNSDMLKATQRLFKRVGDEHSYYMSASPRNFNYLAAGSFRRAYKRDNYVYKISANGEDGERHSDDYGGNRAERRLFKQLRRDGFGWFVPDVVTIPLSDQASCNIMHYYKDDTASWDFWTSPLARAISSFLGEKYDYRDVRQGNLHVLSNGAPVLIDGGVMSEEDMP